MKKKSRVALLVVIAMMFGLTACGKNVIPDMTDEQLQTVGEYAAITLMKYDASNRSRLVDLSTIKEKEPAVTPSPEPAEEPQVGMGSAEDTPTVNKSEQENLYSVGEVLELPEGVTVAYTGSEFCDRYPYAGEDVYFSVVPSEGNKLLVLRFMLSNTSTQDADVDISTAKCSFKVTLNGDYSRKALTTMLLEDLSTYKGKLAAGSSQELVLMVETEAERVENLSSMILNLKNDSKSHTIQVF